MKRSNKRKAELYKKKKTEIFGDIDVKEQDILSSISDWGMMTRSKKRKLELLTGCDYFEDDTKLDRLSSLPDCILADILSHLPIEDAVATSVLSRPWRHLWTQMTRLRFDTLKCDRAKTPSQTFLNFDKRVDHILRQITTSNIHSFSVYFPNPFSVGCKSRLNSWFKQICARNVVEIEVSVITDLDGFLPVPLPSCLLQCKSLKNLKLSGSMRYTLPKKQAIIGFPYLKKLKIRIYEHDDRIKSMLKSIPALQELDLTLYITDDQPIEISAPVLKSLTMWIHCSHSCYQSRIVIDSPKLEYLKIEGHLVWYQFVKHPTQLRSADISGLRRHSRDEIDLFSFISSTRALRLYDFGFLTVLNAPIYGEDRLDASTTFRNLTYLRINVGLKANWRDQVPICVLSKLKRVDVDVYSLYTKIDVWATDLLEYILSNSSVLEQLHVYAHYDDSIIKEEDFCRALFRLPRISRNCEIQFHGRQMKASSLI